MMYAKTRYAADIYSRFRKSGTLFKCYLALLLDGHLTTKQGILCTTLSPAQHGHIMRPVTPLAPDARLCRTAFHVLAQSTNGTLIAARPLTGRMHQIPHNCRSGTPADRRHLIRRFPMFHTPHQALHATQMTFPRLSEQVDLDTVITARVHSPLPRQFQTLLRQLFPPTQFSLSHLDEPDVYACLSAPQTLCEMTHLSYH